MLPPKRVAIFVLGLKDDSRLFKKINKQKLDINSFLLAGILDRLSLLVWAKSKDGQKGRNKPKMLIDILNKNHENFKTFRTCKEFEKEREKLIRGCKK